MMAQTKAQILADIAKAERALWRVCRNDGDKAMLHRLGDWVGKHYLNVNLAMALHCMANAGRCCRKPKKAK